MHGRYNLPKTYFYVYMVMTFLKKKKKVFSLSKYRKIIPPCILQRQKIILNESVIHLTVRDRCLCVDRKFDFRRVTDADMEYV